MVSFCLGNFAEQFILFDVPKSFPLFSRLIGPQILCGNLYNDMVF